MLVIREASLSNVATEFISGIFNEQVGVRVFLFEFFSDYVFTKQNEICILKECSKPIELGICPKTGKKKKNHAVQNTINYLK